MTNAQNIRTTIAKLMEEEQKLKTAYEEAKEQYSLSYERVLVWEEAYTAIGEDERIVQKLDKAYDEYSEADKAMCEAEGKVEAIKEALEALHKAVEAIEWLGL